MAEVTLPFSFAMNISLDLLKFVCYVFVLRKAVQTVTILEDLWYGNVRPTERSIVRGSRLDNLMKLICQNEDDLMSGFTDKQKESFEKFKDCQSEITDYLETEAFAQGFTIAVKLMVEVMKTMEIPEV